MTLRNRNRWNYETYLKRQAGKALLPEVRQKMESSRAARVEWFRSRFAPLVGTTALCLGARYGEEVEALRNLGWTADGIDLNPHPPFVRVGDMNATIEGRYDLIYTNAVDHCWDAPALLRNMRNAATRIVLHLSDGRVGAYETVKWKFLSDVMLCVEEAGFSIERVERMPVFYGLIYEVVAS